MTRALVVVTGMIYLACAVDQWWKGAPGTALMFGGYALANVGIWLQAS